MTTSLCVCAAQSAISLSLSPLSLSLSPCVCVYVCASEWGVLVSVHQLKQRINMERWLNWLGTTCALNGCTATVPVVPASQSESSIQTDHGISKNNTFRGATACHWDSTLNGTTLYRIKGAYYYLRVVIFTSVNNHFCTFSLMFSIQNAPSSVNQLPERLNVGRMLQWRTTATRYCSYLTTETLSWHTGWAPNSQATWHTCAVFWGAEGNLC